MDKRVNKIIEKHSIDFESWTKILNKYIQDPYSKGEISQDDAVHLIHEVVKVLSELTQACIDFGNFKDTFEYDNFRQHFYGPELIINSQKTTTVYYIGFDNNGIYIRTYLKHNFNLKNMDDTFWSSILSLNKFGRFELIEHEHFGKETKSNYPELFNNQKGVVFRLFRKYFVSLLSEEDKFRRKDIIGSLGDLQVSWDSSFGIDKIIEECCEVFKILYKLNYALWKLDDVKAKSEQSSR